MATNATGNTAGAQPKGANMATPRKATNTTPAAPATRTSTAAQVVEMRNVGLASWAQIGQALGFAPRTARRLYQESQGAHQHHGLLPGKGGRLPKAYVATAATALVAPGTAPWVARTVPATGVAGTKGSALAPAPATPAKAKRAPRPKATK